MSDVPASPFRKIDEELVAQGHVVSFYRSTFEGPDGEKFVRDVVKHPGAVSVVPVTDDEHVLLVRQYRAPLEVELLEIVAGKRDVPGEDPVVTAARELQEEVVQAAERFHHLTALTHSPGFCDEVNHIYLATGLTEVPLQQQGIEEEHMTIERIPLGAVRGLIADGSITAAKSIVGLLLGLDRLGR